MKTGAMWWAVMGLSFGPATAGATVDLNHATAAQMQAELGLTRAEAISVIERREQQPFQSADELAMVEGIGAETSAALKGKVNAGDPTADKPAKPAKAPRKKSARKGSHRSKRSPSTKAPAKRSTGSVGQSSLRGNWGYARSSPRPTVGLARH